MKTEGLTEQFEEQRSRLRAIAFRMLGSFSEADDAVQETWLRLNRSRTDEIENLTGWLTTVVTRVCLNMLEARKTRREASLETVLPEPTVTVASLDPEHEALLADSVGLALQVVLESLSPPEPGPPPGSAPRCVCPLSPARRARSSSRVAVPSRWRASPSSKGRSWRSTCSWIQGDSHSCNRQPSILAGEETSHERHAEVRQEHDREKEEVRRIHGRGKSRDAGSRPRDEGGPARGRGGRGTRGAREDRRDAGIRSRHGEAAPRRYQGPRANPLAEALVRDARVCEAGQDHLPLH